MPALNEAIVEDALEWIGELDLQGQDCGRG